MPQLGDFARGNQVGYNNTQKYQYLACEVCGKERWVHVGSMDIHSYRASKLPLCSDCNYKRAYRLSIAARERRKRYEEVKKAMKEGRY